MAKTDQNELARRLLQGDRRALARAISYVENRHPRGRSIMEQIYPRTGRAAVIGVTGAPGVGKSTLVASLVKTYGGRGSRVAVAAVDPSSPFTGGALLGDRIRMDGGRRDGDVFFRSIANRGQVGGVSRATWEIIQLMDAAGYDPIILETVGAGQSEVEVMHIAHTVLVVAAPGLGDEVQAFKAGILEIADLFVVNKADRPDAARTAAELSYMLDLSPDDGGWRPPVLKTVARDDEGIEELVEAIAEHGAYLRGSGRLEEQRRELAERQLLDGATARLARALRGAAAEADAWETIVDGILHRRFDPHTGVGLLLGDDRILKQVLLHIEKLG